MMMKKCLLLVFLTMLTIVSGVFSQEKYLNGYNKKINGQDFNYHSPQPDATKSLLVRSVNSKQFIEWETQKIPSDFNKKRAVFILIAAIDVNEDSHSFNIFLNNEKYFTVKNPLTNIEKKLNWIGKNNTKLDFNATMIDRHGDMMGYMFLDVPVELFTKGKAISIKVQGENTNSQSWFMVYKYKNNKIVNLFAENAIIRENGANFQLVRIDIVHFDKPQKAIIIADNKKIELKLDLGYNTYKLKIPPVSKNRLLPVRVLIGNKSEISEKIIVKPVKKKIVYLLHHSHVDIGYTHVQKEVEELHWKYFDEVIEYSKNSRNYPIGSRFKWNVEVMWAVDSYLNNTSTQKKAEFINAVKQGWIGLDALYGNELTGLCNTEELIRLTESGRRISKICGVSLESAMITDVPGWTWGIVPVLAKSGVKYISMGTNFGHRIGGTIEKWGDRPFYWVSPSGEEKILCWIHEKAYSMFHSGLDKSALKHPDSEKKVFQYLSELEKNKYPYDIIPLRYNIGSDNGPPDPDLAETVLDWNNKYVSPKLIISTTTEMFKAFEDKYGHKLAVVRGDFTPYWEDGAASSAEETGKNRQSADRLVQAEALWAMLDPENYPAEDFEKAWKNVLLYNEHTWGSWNSISDPENEFTLSQWEHKKSFADSAEQQSIKLVKKVFNNLEINENNNLYFNVFNTCSWQRTDLVSIPVKSLAAGSVISDKNGNISPVQQLFSGEFVFVAKNIPPMGSKTFYITEGKAETEKILKIESNSLSNKCISAEIDEITGSISSLISYKIPVNLVNNSEGGINSYYYVSGRNPDNPKGMSDTKISLKENGPVVVSLLVESKAVGCYNLSREYRLISGLNRLDIINIINKKKVYQQESVHIGFPFNIKNGVVKLDIVYGLYRPEHDQLPGACKNYFTIEDWIDISNQDYGITLSSADAPLFEIGNITTDPVVFGWLDHIENSQTIYSYVMNNYWETNYRAAQEGPVKFRYSIKPHQQFNSSEAEKFGIEQNQPLIAVPVTETTISNNSLFEIKSEGIIATSVKPSGNGKSILIKLFNAGGKPEVLKLLWKIDPSAVFMSNFDAEIIEKAPEIIKIPAYGIRIIRAEY